MTSCTGFLKERILASYLRNFGKRHTSKDEKTSSSSIHAESKTDPVWYDPDQHPFFREY
jgi:hypothetical protein